MSDGVLFRVLVHKVETLPQTRWARILLIPHLVLTCPPECLTTKVRVLRGILFILLVPFITICIVAIARGSDSGEGGQRKCCAGPSATEFDYPLRKLSPRERQDTDITGFVAVWALFDGLAINMASRVWTLKYTTFPVMLNNAS
ncbi:hypothetical protein F4824DRAFT_108592 [Ustulina deusta]|nr:hypothetical protein F4824DRAFT_108592 [Ustulina deusta]